MSTPRRDFLRNTAGGALGLFVAARPEVGWAMGKRRKPINRYDTASFSAFVDTVIPGPGTDPTGAPGALQAGTLEYLVKVQDSKLFPISLDLVHFLLTRALDLVAGLRRFCPFEKLSLEERQDVIAGLGWVPGWAFLLRLVRAPFYTGAMNRVGFDYLGYPGPNEGYSDFSFREEISRPEPSAIDGNMP